jgi:hypothetical protein
MPSMRRATHALACYISTESTLIFYPADDPPTATGSNPSGTRPSFLTLCMLERIDPEL